MLKLKERNRLQSLFLEVLEDQNKRELLLYLLCYVQLVKKEGSFSVSLDEFLRCAYRSFRSNRHQWKDVLVELNLLKITDIYGSVYSGKDIYKIQEDSLLFISLDPAYAEDFYLISNKLVKYWGIVHKLEYGKLWNVQDAINLGVYIFNEELYEEYMDYAEIQKERFRKEAVFFEALEEIIKGLTAKSEKNLLHWLKAMELLKKLPDIYYGINVGKLKKDVENNWKRAQKGKKVEKIKVDFIKPSKKSSFWQRLKESFLRIYRRFVYERPWNIHVKNVRSKPEEECVNV
ncbi:hypothetical protein [Thermocrinis jamiesonii]|uniref:hypothetical protein n=1 Tax=Thermocrinis jamiesonii TaxID=1302351 RepID=UPI0012DEBE69|nr:hypothetical protein [Thermocrinis jamiesonii]